MNRYLLFAGRSYGSKADGGWHNFIVDTDDFEDAVAAGDRTQLATGAEWWHVLDTETMELHSPEEERTNGKSE